MAMTGTSDVPFGYHFRMTQTDIEALLHYLLATGGSTARDIHPQMRYEEFYDRHPRDLLADGSPCWFFSSTLRKSSNGNIITHHCRIAQGGQWRRTTKVQDFRTSNGNKIGEVRKFEFRTKNSPDGKEWIKTEFLATEYRAWFPSSAWLSTVALYNVYTTSRKHMHHPSPAASDDAIPVYAGIPVAVTADLVDASIPVAILPAPPVTADHLPTANYSNAPVSCFLYDNPEWYFSPDELLSDRSGPAVSDQELIPATDDQTLVSGDIPVDVFALPGEPIFATQYQRSGSEDLIAADVPVRATQDHILDNVDHQCSLFHGDGLLEDNPIPIWLDQPQYPQPLYPTGDQFPTDSALVYDNDAPYCVDPMIGTPATVLAEQLFGDDEWLVPLEQFLGKRSADTTEHEEDAQGSNKRTRQY